MLILRTKTIVIALAVMMSTSGCRTARDEVVLDSVNVTRFGGDRSGDGLEPYFALIEFSAVFDNPGSIKVDFINSRTTLDRDNLNESTGWVEIPERNRGKRSVAGPLPIADDSTEAFRDGVAISGVVIAGFEADNRGWKAISPAMAGLESEIADSLAANVAGKPWNIVAVPNMLSNFAGLSPDLDLSFWKKIRFGAARLFTGGGREDDFMGVSVALTVHIGQTYYDELKSIWGAVAASNNVTFPRCRPTSLDSIAFGGKEASLTASMCSVEEILQDENSQRDFQYFEGGNSFQLRLREEITLESD